MLLIMRSGIGIPDIITHHPDSSTIPADLDEWFRYWSVDMKDDIAPGTIVGLYADFPEDPTTYFLTFRDADGNLESVDIFHTIFDDPTNGEDDVSLLGGAQCPECGRTNVMWGMDQDDIAKIGEIPQPVFNVPVWRQAPDGAHILCDDCADGVWKA